MRTAVAESIGTGGRHAAVAGNLLENLSLLDLAKRSLWEPLQQLRAAKVTTASANVKPADASFFGGTLLGYIDLLVTNQAGKSAVIDLKLGGPRRRQEELKSNRQLQLAVYGCLQNARVKSWPEADFYFLSQQRLLTQTDTFFPKATAQRTDVDKIGLENCWKDFEAIWRWRRTSWTRSGLKSPPRHCRKNQMPHDRTRPRPANIGSPIPTTFNITTSMP